jgi:nucleoside-diphosphate-sugar epimerase
VRVVVTGAHGFVGRALERALRERGDEVFGLDQPDGDIAQPGRWQDRFAGADLAIHTAASLSGGLAHRDRIWQVNAVGTVHVLDAAERHGVPRVVHLSSVSVFGVDFPDGVTEATPPRSFGLPYADAKIASEQAVLQRHAEGGVTATVVRPGDVYGPGSGAWAVLPVRKIRARQFVLPRGGIFSPVHVDDLVRGILLAAEAPGHVITLSGGVGVPNERFFGTYADALGVPLRTAPLALLRPASTALSAGARVLRADDDVNPRSAEFLARRGTYSIAKAERLLGWRPEIDVQDGLAGTLAWLRAEGLVPPA